MADADWREKARGLLAQAVLRLETLLANAGLEIVGGTFLFRLVRTKDAEWQRLGAALAAPV